MHVTTFKLKLNRNCFQFRWEPFHSRWIAVKECPSFLQRFLAWIWGKLPVHSCSKLMAKMFIFIGTLTHTVRWLPKNQRRKSVRLFCPRNFCSHPVVRQLPLERKFQSMYLETTRLLVVSSWWSKNHQSHSRRPRNPPVEFLLPQDETADGVPLISMWTLVFQRVNASRRWAILVLLLPRECCRTKCLPQSQR